MRKNKKRRKIYEDIQTQMKAMKQEGKDYMRLNKFEFDILDIALKYQPNPVSFVELTFELRERGHDITIDELKECLLE